MCLRPNNWQEVGASTIGEQWGPRSRSGLHFHLVFVTSFLCHSFTLFSWTWLMPKTAVQPVEQHLSKHELISTAPSCSNHTFTIHQIQKGQSGFSFSCSWDGRVFLPLFCPLQPNACTSCKSGILAVSAARICCLTHIIVQHQVLTVTTDPWYVGEGQAVANTTLLCPT